MIGQLSHDGIGSKTRVKFVISHWWVSIRLLIVKLFGFWSVLLSRSVRSPFVGFVLVMDKSFVWYRYLLTSVKRRLFWVSIPVFQSQSLKIVCTVG